MGRGLCAGGGLGPGGSVKEHGDDPAWDAADAEALYERLEQQVAPEFYTRDEGGVPTAWVARMRESMTRLTPQYSAHRAVRDYVDQHYLAAAAAYRVRAADKGAAAAALVVRRNAQAAKWPSLRFGVVSVRRDGDRQAITVEVFLGGMDPATVRVELYAEGLDGRRAERVEMMRERPLGVDGGQLYCAPIPSGRPAAEYTARITPLCAGLASPLEAPWILWQK